MTRYYFVACTQWLNSRGSLPPRVIRGGIFIQVVGRREVLEDGDVARCYWVGGLLGLGGYRRHASVAARR